MWLMGDKWLWGWAYTHLYQWQNAPGLQQMQNNGIEPYFLFKKNLIARLLGQTFPKHSALIYLRSHWPCHWLQRSRVRPTAIALENSSPSILCSLERWDIKSNLGFRLRETTRFLTRLPLWIRGGHLTLLCPFLYFVPRQNSHSLLLRILVCSRHTGPSPLSWFRRTK